MEDNTQHPSLCSASDNAEDRTSNDTTVSEQLKTEQAPTVATVVDGDSSSTGQVSAPDTGIPAEQSSGDHSQGSPVAKRFTRKGCEIWHDITNAKASVLIAQDDIEKIARKLKAIQTKVKKAKDKKKAVIKKGTNAVDERMVAADEALTAILQEREEMKAQDEAAKAAELRARTELGELESEMVVTYQNKVLATKQVAKETITSAEETRGLGPTQLTERREKILSNMKEMVRRFKEEYHIED